MKKIIGLLMVVSVLWCEIAVADSIVNLEGCSLDISFDNATEVTINTHGAAWREFDFGDINNGEYYWIDDDIVVHSIIPFSIFASFTELPLKLAIDLFNGKGIMETETGDYSFSFPKIDNITDVIVSRDFFPISEIDNSNNSVPEPATIILFIIGLLCIFNIQRKKEILL